MGFAQKIGQNGYNSVTRPPIKILSPLFTLQLLILPTRDPFHAQKSYIYEQKLSFLYFDPYFKTRHGKSHNFCVKNLNAKNSIFALSFSFFGHEMGP